MGVLSLQLLVCGQLILFSLAVENTTYPRQITESLSELINTSQNNSSTTAPALNTTGNYTENNTPALLSKSTYNSSNTNLTTSTSQMTPTRPQNTTWVPKQNNDTTTGSTIQPNTTTAHTIQPNTTTAHTIQPNTTTAHTIQPNTTTAHTIQPNTTTVHRTTVRVNSTAFTSPYNSTYISTTVRTTVKTSAVTKTTKKAVTTVTLINSTDFTIHSSDLGLSHSEKSLTVLFSVLLGVIVLIILVYSIHKFSKRKQTRTQYTHRRLQNEDAGEQFAVSDDTLVPSGGLYDGPQIYNPSMTVQNEEDFETDTLGLPYRPTHFRLEFLREDPGRAGDRDTFDTFQKNDQEP